MSPQSSDIAPAEVPVEDKALDKESVIELLGEDDGKEPETIELDEDKKAGKKDTKEPKGDEEEEETTLEDELEEELEEPVEDSLEIIEPPSRKEILTAYPDLFKKFPALEKAMYRDKAYSEILPTIEDARIAAEKSTLLDEYEEEIQKGSTESLLSAVKDNDKETFAKVVDNYLPTLFKVDEHAYYHTIGNVIKHTIISMVRDGESQKNRDLANAASVLNQYIFGTSQFSHPQKLSKSEIQDDGTRAKEEEITTREKALAERQFNSTLEDLSTRVDNVLKASVDKFIDPNDSMTEYVKRTATKDVLDNLENLIEKDVRFKSVYDRLWERAYENDYDKESMDKIKAAYLSKAKTLLPVLIRKSRNEALRGLNRNSGDSKDKRGHLPVGKTRSSTTLASGKSSSSDSKQVPRGMSTLDYLNSD